MQGLADGYFVLPNTIGDYLASAKLAKVDARSPGVPARPRRRSPSARRSFLESRASARWTHSTASSGKIMWDYCGMARNEAGLKKALSTDSRSCARSSGSDVNVPGSDAELNQALEKAGRVADFLELGELMCRDALHREESCGGHFREENQTPDGEALRDDEQFAYVAAWEYAGTGPRAACCTRSRWSSRT